MDRTQIITIYKGPLHIINNYNSTCVSNNKLQYTTLMIINKFLWKMKKHKHKKYKAISMKLYNTKMYKHSLFIILVCEMEATGLI